MANSGTSGDLIPDRRWDHECDSLAYEWSAERLDHALKQLPRPERRVVEGRILSDSPLTLEALGARENRCGETARQDEIRALSKLGGF